MTTELEYWACIDDITIATTAELAPRVMDRLREIVERHGLELRSDKCTAYCPTPGRADGVREEMTQFVKWTPDGLMILGTASDMGISNRDHNRSSKKSRANERKATKCANSGWQDQADVRS